MLKQDKGRQGSTRHHGQNTEPHRVASRLKSVVKKLDGKK